MPFESNRVGRARRVIGSVCVRSHRMQFKCEPNKTRCWQGKTPTNVGLLLSCLFSRIPSLLRLIPRFKFRKTLDWIIKCLGLTNSSHIFIYCVQKNSPTRNRTKINGFKVHGIHHCAIGPLLKNLRFPNPHKLWRWR